jgi:hypothetical protein
MGDEAELTVIHGVPIIPLAIETIDIAQECASAILSSPLIHDIVSRYIVNKLENIGNDPELTGIHGVPLIPPPIQNINISQERASATLSSFRIHKTI